MAGVETLIGLLTMGGILMTAYAYHYSSFQKLERDWERFAMRHDGQIEPTFRLMTPSTIEVRVPSEGRPITLRLHQSQSNNQPSYTEVDAIVASTQRLSIRKQMGVLSRLGTSLGRQDIRVGDPDYDREFRVQGSDPRWVKVLLGRNESLRKRHLQAPERAITLEGGALSIRVQEVLRLQRDLDALLEFTRELVEAIHSVPKLLPNDERMQGQLSLARDPGARGGLSVAGAGQGDLTQTDED